MLIERRTLLFLFNPFLSSVRQLKVVPRRSRAHQFCKQLGFTAKLCSALVVVPLIYLWQQVASRRRWWHACRSDLLVSAMMITHLLIVLPYQSISGDTMLFDQTIVYQDLLAYNHCLPVPLVLVCFFVFLPHLQRSCWV